MPMTAPNSVFATSALREGSMWRAPGRGTQTRPDGVRMTGAVECRYYGRDFSAEEMALRRALIAGPPPLNRHALSKEFCRRIRWLKPDGGLKDMMARVTMLAMHKDGLITLPPPRWERGRQKPIVFGPDTEPPLFPAPTTLDDVRSLDLRTVVCGTREGKLWNEFIARYHYLGYKTLVGAQMRYAVHDRDGWPLAMLGFSTAAWKRAPRVKRLVQFSRKPLSQRCLIEGSRKVHRMDPAEARKEPPPRGRQPEVPDPALDHDPKSRLAHPRPHPPPPTGSCVIGEGVQRRRTVDEHEQRLIASISKSMAVMCVRNTTLEDIHVGIAPVSHTGDFSDVVVIDANGRRIPWPEVSRIGCCIARNSVMDFSVYFWSAGGRFLTLLPLCRRTDTAQNELDAHIGTAVSAVATVLGMRMSLATRLSLASGRASARRSWVGGWAIQNTTSWPSKRSSCPSWLE